MKNTKKDLTKAKVQYVLDKDDLENVLRGIIDETITENNSKKSERYLTIAKAAEMLGVTKTTLWRWEKEDFLLPVRTGTKIRYRESDIIRVMEGRSDV